MTILLPVLIVILVYGFAYGAWWLGCRQMREAKRELALMQAECEEYQQQLSEAVSGDDVQKAISLMQARQNRREQWIARNLK